MVPASWFAAKASAANNPISFVYGRLSELLCRCSFGEGTRQEKIHPPKRILKLFRKQLAETSDPRKAAKNCWQRKRLKSPSQEIVTRQVRPSTLPSGLEGERRR